MVRTLRRAVVPLLAMVVVVATSTAAGAVTDRQRAAGGAAYLVSQQQPDGSIPAFSPIGSTADAVLAFVSAGVGRGAMLKAIGYLRDQTQIGNVDTVGLRSKVVLALEAANRGDPRNFGGHNLVMEIGSTLGPDGRFGEAPVLEDALAVLAIVASGAPLPTTASSWLLDAQCPDGGWAYDEPYDPVNDDAHCHSGSLDFFDSDSNTTSYVVQALMAAGDNSWGASPFAYFETVRDPVHGGWSYSAAFLATDTNSTALVLQAIAARGFPAPASGLEALRQLQHTDCGAWAYTWDGAVIGPPDVGATIGAIPGIRLDPLPIAPRTVRVGVPSLPACA
jgi:hypothetical protein